MMNTQPLKQFAEFLRNDVSKITDALFVENLIIEIEKRDKLTFDVVDRWLLRAFDFPKDYKKYTCFDTYNRSLYHQIISKLQ